MMSEEVGRDFTINGTFELVNEVVISACPGRVCTWGPEGCCDQTLKKRKAVQQAVYGDSQGVG